MPKLSVCMPIYNTNPQHLREAIESVLTQTFKDFEFLILNDSPDNKNLKKIVSEYKDSRIVYLENKKNMGISESRNRLVKISKGEYIAVCDHDDISVQDRFEKQVAILDKNPAVGVVSAQIKWFPNKEVRWQSRNPIKNYDIKIRLMTGCAVLHPVSMIRKSVMVENNVFYEDRFSPAEDYRLWTRLIEFTQFRNIDEVLLHYRWYGENTSVSQQARLQDAASEIRLLAQNKYPELSRDWREKQKTYIKLFNFFPLLRIKRRPDKIKIYLFYIIPILKIKKRW